MRKELRAEVVRAGVQIESLHNELAQASFQSSQLAAGARKSEMSK